MFPDLVFDLPWPKVYDVILVDSACNNVAKIPMKVVGKDILPSGSWNIRVKLMEYPTHKCLHADCLGRLTMADALDLNQDNTEDRPHTVSELEVRNYQRFDNLRGLNLWWVHMKGENEPIAFRIFTIDNDLKMSIGACPGCGGFIGLDNGFSVTTMVCPYCGEEIDIDQSAK